MDDVKASSLIEGLLIHFQRDLRFAVPVPRKPWFTAATSLILTAAVYLHPTTLPISLSALKAFPLAVVKDQLPLNGTFWIQCKILEIFTGIVNTNVP